MYIRPIYSLVFLISSLYVTSIHFNPVLVVEPPPGPPAQPQEAVRARFHQAFTFQKAAYRRGNGGTAAPSLVEDAPARR